MRPQKQQQKKLKYCFYDVADVGESVDEQDEVVDDTEEVGAISSLLLVVEEEEEEDEEDEDDDDADVGGNVSRRREMSKGFDPYKM